MSETPKLDMLIASIRGIEVEVSDTTAGRVADRLDTLRVYVADALEELRQTLPVRHGGDRHNQAMFCSCEKCI